MSLLRAIARADLIGAALVVAAGVFLVVRSPAYQLHRDGVMGPGFFPFWAGVALVIFGVATAVGAAMRAHRTVGAAGDDVGTPDADDGHDHAEPTDPPGLQEAPVSDDEPGSVGRGKAVRLSIVFGLTILAVALIPLTGIYIAFGVFILVLVAAVEREHWATSIAVAAGSIIVLYLIFSVLLHIPVPTGPWGF